MLDLERHLNTATAFFLAGERCELELRFSSYDLHTLHAPTISNYAFSVELALKLIHVLQFKTAPKEHSLKVLFNSLTQEAKDRLPHLAECVEEIDSYFIDSRYPFEKQFLLGDVETPRRAFIEIYKEIRRIEPELVSVFESNWGKFEPEWIRSWSEDRPQWELRPMNSQSTKVIGGRT
jgi:HEPN domain-containing protein